MSSLLLACTNSEKLCLIFRLFSDHFFHSAPTCTSTISTTSMVSITSTTSTTATPLQGLWNARTAQVLGKWDARNTGVYTPMHSERLQERQDNNADQIYNDFSEYNSDKNDDDSHTDSGKYKHEGNEGNEKIEMITQQLLTLHSNRSHSKSMP